MKPATKYDIVAVGSLVCATVHQVAGNLEMAAVLTGLAVGIWLFNNFVDNKT